MRAVVTVAHSSGGKAGAEHNIPRVNKDEVSIGIELLLKLTSLPEYPAWVLIEDNCVGFRFVHELPFMLEQTVDKDFSVAVHSNYFLAPQFPLNPFLLLLHKKL